MHTLTPAELAAELDDYVALRARWMRFDLNWHVIQLQGRTSYQWEAFDRVVRAARERGLKVLAVLRDTPPWARGQAGEPATAPSNPADYAVFAAEAVRRYAPMGVHHFELWNEPNLVRFWKPRPDAARYAELIKVAYPAMKAVDPSITVLAGSTAPVGGYNDPRCDGGSNPDEREDVNAVTFLERMYANGAAGSFDALSHHPYENAGPSNTHRCSAWNQMQGTSPSLRSLMSANGDADKQIWATEYGNDTRVVGEEVAAERVPQAFRLWRSYQWAGALLYHTYRDLPCCPGYDLVRRDGSKTPAWFAYRDALE
jgi:polysaccharide biosynthesis protein PslG